MRKRNDYINLSELESIFDKLGIKRKRHEFCGVTDQQYRNWKKRGKLPKERFWAFQKEMCIFLDKESLRKKVILGLIDKEFLEELIELIDDQELL